MQASGTMTLSTYGVLIALNRPATTHPVPAETYTTEGREGYSYERTVTVPPFPGVDHVVEGKVLGYTVLNVNIKLPATEGQTYTETLRVPPVPPVTVVTKPASTDYTDPGAVQVSGAFVHDDPTEHVDIYLGDKVIASGKGRIPFAYAGTAASCKNSVQEITTLVLYAKTGRGTMISTGFLREEYGPSQGQWISPVLSLRPYDITSSFRANMQAEGTPGTRPNLFVRYQVNGSNTWSGWTNQGLPSDARTYQFMIHIERGQKVRSLTWLFDTEYPEPEDPNGESVNASGHGLSYVPNLWVAVDGKDISAAVSSVSDGQMTLALPRGSTLPAAAGSSVTVLLDGELVDSGYVSSVRRPASSSGTKIELTYLRTGQLLGATTTAFPGGVNVKDNDVSVSGKQLVQVGMNSLENSAPTLPFDNEGGFITTVLGNSPGSAQLLMDTKREFRSLDFWSADQDLATGTGGLAFKEASEWQQHYGAVERAGLDVIEQVCAANLMSVFPTEDGNLLVSDLIPVPEKTLADIVKPTIGADGTVQSSCYIRFHEQGENFFPDYRLSIPERSFDVSDMSPFVDVIGTSGPNQINREVPPTPVYVMFEANMSPTKEGAVKFQNWDFLNLGGSSRGVNTFTFVDSNKNPIAIKIGTEHVDHRITSQRGQWNVQFEYIKGTLSYEDVDGDGQTTGDNDDVTGYTGVRVKYTLTDQTTDCHLDLLFAVTGEYLVHGEWETKELRGKANAAYVPKWLPDMMQEASDIRRRFGFEIREENNPYVTSLVGYPPEASPAAQHEWETLPDRVATGMTIKEYLKSRQTELRYCGNAAWVPNQFVAIAKPPMTGVGTKIQSWEVYFTLDCGTIDITVGGEINHVVKAAYLGTVNRDGDGFVVAETLPAVSDWFS